MRRWWLLSLVGLLAASRGASAAEVPGAAAAEVLAARLEAALEGAEPARLRPLLPPAGPVTAWVANQARASATQGARRADWRVSFSPFYADARAMGGLLALEARAPGEAPATATFPVEAWARGQGWTIGDPLPTARLDARVVSRALNLDLREPGRLRGELQVALELAGPDRRLFARLGQGTRLLEVAQAGQRLGFTQQGEWLYVGLAAGEARPVLTLRWEGDGPVLGNVPRHGALPGEARWFPELPEAAGGEGAWDLAVMAPVGWAALAPGQAVEPRRFPDGWLYRYVVDTGRAPWPLWLGDWPQVALVDSEPRVEAWTREALAPEGARLTQEAWQAAVDLGELLGGFPVARLAFAEGSPVSGAGGLTRLDTDTLRNDELRPWQAARAVAGAVVSRRQAEGRPGEVAWLTEALPSYLAALTAVRRSGAAGLREPLLAAYRRYDTLAGSAGDVAISAAQRGSDEETWRRLTEDKGVMVWHMLRRRLGDPAFARLLADCYGAAAAGPLRISDVRRVGERAAGVPLGRFFSQWLDTAGRPRLTLEGLSVEQGRKGWVVRGRLVQERSAFALRVPLVLTTAGRPRVYEVDLASEATRFVLQSPDRPLGLRIDPIHDTLAASVAPPALSP